MVRVPYIKIHVDFNNAYIFYIGTRAKYEKNENYRICGIENVIYCPKLISYRWTFYSSKIDG